MGTILQDIFIPDTDYINREFQAFLQEMQMKFNFNTDFFEGLFSMETPVKDEYMDYTIPGVGSFEFKVLDTKFFVDGVTYFRPFIRGFLVLMMMLYHIRMLVGFFGYDAGVVQGRQDWVAYQKADTGGHKN